MFDPISLLSIGGSLLGGLFGSSNAASQQAEAAKRASDLQAKQFDATQAMLAPQIAAGNSARGVQMSLLGLPGGSMSSPEAMQLYRSAPGYQGGLKAGQNGINTGAANAGMMRSSANIGDLANFGSQYDANAFNGYFGRLGDISGAGSQATGALAGYGAQNANSLANIAMNAGNNQAAGSINMANVGTGAAQNLLDLYYRGGGGRIAPGGWSDGGMAFGGGR